MRSDFTDLAGVDRGLFIATLGHPAVPQTQAGAGRAADDLDSAGDGIGLVARKEGVL